MAALKMGKYISLNKKEIDEKVSKKLGNYALGHVEDGKFVEKYIGRSDDDLNARLHDWIGKYPKFKFSHKANTRKEAFIKECKNFHDFGGTQKLDNTRHPDRPTGYDKNTLPCSKQGCKN